MPISLLRRNRGDHSSATPPWQREPRQSPMLADSAQAPASLPLGLGVLPFGDTPSGSESGEATPCGWDISPGTRTPHLLVAGATGSGLSTTLRSIAVSATAQRFDVVALHAGGLPGLVDLEGWPGVRRFAADAEGYTSALQLVHNELDARFTWLNRAYRDRHDRVLTELRASHNAASNAGVPTSESTSSSAESSVSKLRPLVVLIDTWTIALAMLRSTDHGANAAQTQLQEVLGLGRSARIHVALVGHRLNIDALPSELRSEFTARIALSGLVPAARQILWNVEDEPPMEPPMEPSRTPGRGLAILDKDHRPKPIQVWDVPDLHTTTVARPDPYPAQLLSEQ